MIVHSIWPNISPHFLTWDPNLPSPAAGLPSPYLGHLCGTEVADTAAGLLGDGSEQRLVVQVEGGKGPGQGGEAGGVKVGLGKERGEEAGRLRAENQPEVTARRRGGHQLEDRAGAVGSPCPMTGISNVDCIGRRLLKHIMCENVHTFCGTAALAKAANILLSRCPTTANAQARLVMAAGDKPCREGAS